MPLEEDIPVEWDVPRPTVIEIEGVDCTDYLRNWSVDKTIGEAVGTANVEFVWKVSDVHAISGNDAVEIWRYNDSSEELDKIFSGYVESVDRYAGVVTVNAKDKAWMLVRREITYSYDADIDPSAGKISAIFKDIVETYGLLNATVQDSGTAYVLKKFVCNHATCYERCKRLADALGWQFYYDTSDDTVHFEPYGFILNTHTLVVGDDIAKTPTWTRENITEMANQITAIGAYQEVETTQYFNGNGSNKDFSLIFIPVSTKVYIYTGGNWVLQTGSVEGSGGSYDYSVDKVNQQINFVVAPATGTNNVEVNYSYAVPTPVVQNDQLSIDNYNDFQRTMFLQDVRRTDDAESRAYNELQKYSQPFENTKLELKQDVIGEYDFDIGTEAHITDAINNVDDDFVVNRVSLCYPSKVDMFYVGKKEWRLAEWSSTVEERIHNLESQSYEDQGVLLHVVSVGKNFKFYRKSLQILKRNINDSFVLGGIPNGVLGYNPAASVHPKLGCYADSWSAVYTKNY